MRKPAYAFIKEWFDKRQGRVRRRGFKSIELPGPLGSLEFIRAYESAMADAPPSLGAKKRSRPGTVSAAIASYYSSEQYFGTLESSTQASRRALLERFRQEHGERTLADIRPSS